MNRIFGVALLALTLGFGVQGFAADAPQCTKGKACGGICIAKDKECHVTPLKECKTGKLCGDSCIAVTKTCTK